LHPQNNTSRSPFWRPQFGYRNPVERSPRLPPLVGTGRKAGARVGALDSHSHNFMATSKT
jgi:hypothetical protein